MKINKDRFKQFSLIVIGILFLFSCEKVNHTTFRIRIINDSSHNYIVEHDILPNLDTILAPLNIDSHKCGVTIFKQVSNEVLPKITEDDFTNKVLSLKIYYLTDENDTIYYGGNKVYCQKISSWKYDYSEDDGYGLHEYILRIED